MNHLIGFPPSALIVEAPPIEPRPVNLYRKRKPKAEIVSAEAAAAFVSGNQTPDEMLSARPEWASVGLEAAMQKARGCFGNAAPAPINSTKLAAAAVSYYDLCVGMGAADRLAPPRMGLDELRALFKRSSSFLCRLIAWECRERGGCFLSDSDYTDAVPANLLRRWAELPDDGKWLLHMPGDPMPCRGDVVVDVAFGRDVWVRRVQASSCSWKAEHVSIIAWRIA